MRSLVILFSIISQIILDKINYEDFNNIVDTIRTAADEYDINEESLNQSSYAKKDNALSKTLTFTTKSKFHDHMITVDLIANNDKLGLNLYNAKSNAIKKEIIYDRGVFEMQKSGLKELVHRMVERPKSKVAFKMIEDVLADIMPKFNSLAYTKEVTEDGMRLKFMGHESVVALFNIIYGQRKISEDPERFNCALDVIFDISTVNNKPDRFNFGIDVFNEESTNKWLQTIKLTNIDEYFNNLCTVASIYTKASDSKIST